MLTLVWSSGFDDMRSGPRVVLVDDDAELLDAVRRLLESHFDIVGTAQDSQSALAAAKDLEPDLLVMDITMPSVGGIETARRLLQQNSSARIVFLTMHQDPALLEQALSTGALGYVLKVEARTELVTALNEVLAGRTFVSSAMRRQAH